MQELDRHHPGYHPRHRPDPFRKEAMSERDFWGPPKCRSGGFTCPPDCPILRAGDCPDSD